MKSIKPGRGPSMMEGVMSLLVAGIGVVWTILAVSMGAGFMAVFGIAFIAIAVAQAVGGFYNATAKERTSIVDIVDSEEEGDPLAAHIHADSDPAENAPDALKSDEALPVGGFCPYCGAKAKEDHRFCARCGKPLK